MKVWMLDCDVDQYENLMPGGKLDINTLRTFNGESKKDDWEPLLVKRMYGDREFSNTPGFSTHIPVFDERAVSVLKAMLNDEAEILPLKCEDGKFYAINVTEVLDCIDYKNSEFKMFRDGKRIMRFSKYSFMEDVVLGHSIFKIKDEPLKRPFVSDEFRKLVIQNRLTGFIFELAWDSETELYVNA